MLRSRSEVRPKRLCPRIRVTERAVPRPLRTNEIAGIVADFRAAARRAVDAGMDGVEIHSANGYLLHEFLSDVTNRRDDAYGGSAHNRARLTAEVVQAVVDVSGRPYCVHEGEPDGQQYVVIGGTYIGSLTRHVFETISYHAGIALHIRVLSGRDPHQA